MLQITDTAVGVASTTAGILLAVLTVIMAVVALGPYLPWSVGKELDTEAAQGRAADDPEAVEEA